MIYSANLLCSCTAWFISETTVISYQSCYFSLPRPVVNISSIFGNHLRRWTWPYTLRCSWVDIFDVAAITFGPQNHFAIYTHNAWMEHMIRNLWYIYSIVTTDIIVLTDRFVPWLHVCTPSDCPGISLVIYTTSNVLHQTKLLLFYTETLSSYIE